MDKRIITTTLTLLLILTFTPTTEASTITFEGHIQAGQPGTLTGTSISGDTVASCDPEHPLNGIDAVWFRLLVQSEEHHFRLEMPPTLDVDVQFYNKDCTWIRSSWGAQGFQGETEMGPVPDEAVYAVVDGFSGTGNFTLTVTPGPQQPPAPESFHRAPIQPGGLSIAHVGPTWQHCTLNFVYEDDSGQLYIGAAGHCTSGVGSRVGSPNIGNFGTVVYHEVHNPGTPQLLEPTKAPQAMDFALIAIDEDRYAYVDPAMREWGGPVAVAQNPDSGSLVHHYGHAGLYDTTEPTRQRTGVLEYMIEDGAYDGWFVGAQATYGGDSGGAVLTGNGEALGTINTVAATAGGTQAGPTIALVLDHLKDEFPGLRLVTAPFTPIDERGPDDHVEDLVSLVEQCRAHPISKYQDSQGCYKQGGLPNAAADLRRCAPRALWLEDLFTGCSLLS